MKTFIKILTLCAGIILGGYLGELALNVPALKFLAAGNELGLTSPFVLNLDIIKLTFGMTIKLNIGGIIGFVVALIIIKKVL